MFFFNHVYEFWLNLSLNGSTKLLYKVTMPNYILTKIKQTQMMENVKKC